MPHVVGVSAVTLGQLHPSALQADLVAMLEATRRAERDLFRLLTRDTREAHGADGGWSPKDVLAHMAAWRSIEARRLEAAAGRDSGILAGDPAPNDPIYESNALLHARYAALSWEVVAGEADASIEALVQAIGHSSTDVLCECDGTFAGIGANGANHAMGHLTDIAELAGGLKRFDEFAQEVESILRRGHVPPRDAGVILYNIACHRALSGELNEARRLLRNAFARHHVLLESAREDPDLASVRDELAALAQPRERSADR